MTRRNYVMQMVLLLALSVSLAAVPSRAQQATENDINRTELNNFNRFLDSHPKVAQELRNNPRLVDDPAYLSKHPDLQKFISVHPRVREELKENPQTFMNREQKFDKNKPGTDINHTELGNFDRFLDQHPKVDRELQKNPGLVDDPAYLAKHPELNTFLTSHPHVREELKENPSVFMNREKRLDKKESDRSGRRGMHHRQ